MQAHFLYNFCLWIFWLSGLLLFYTYVGYGLLMEVINYCKGRRGGQKVPLIIKEAALPDVCLIVAAYNEAKCLEEKIRNALSLNYPAGKLQVLVITDGSTDESPGIVARYSMVQHLHQPERAGKTAALNRAVAVARASILVFSDANAMLNRDSILLLANHFADPAVGGVAGEKKVDQSVPGANKEGLYWRYESWLKKLDAENGSVMGAAGELFAIRRSLYEPLPDNIVLDDFVQSLQVVIRGYRLAYEPRAFAMEKPSATVKEEMKRKIRIAAGAFQAMIRLKPLFNIIRYPGDAFRFISHRVLRWTVCPPALLLLLLSNISIFISCDSLFYAVSLLLQLLFYLAALLALIFQKLGWRSGIMGLPYYFLQMNVSVCIGFIRFITGGQSVLWEKADRA